MGLAVLPSLALLVLLATSESTRVIEHLGDCNHRSKCVKGTVCAGRPGRQRCVIAAGLGDTCGRTAVQVCEGQLHCTKFRCVPPPIKAGNSCLGAETNCVQGTVCAGRPDRKRCEHPMKKGQSCRRDPFWVCAEGLECFRNKCMPPAIKPGNSCLEKSARCQEGSVCAGRKDRKRCVVPMKEGGRCGADPFWICAEGLECYKRRCHPPAIPRGRTCLKKGSRCEEGTVCAGSRTRKRCVVPMGNGKRCRKDPFWICEEGLLCTDGVCLPPPAKRGSSCEGKGVRCVEGAVCVGKKGKRKCVRGRTGGMRCAKDELKVCAEGYKCVAGVCKGESVGKGRPCNGLTRVCEKSLHCVAGKKVGVTICAKIREVGDECKNEPAYRCAEGLVCVKGVCTLEVGGPWA